MKNLNLLKYKDVSIYNQDRNIFTIKYQRQASISVSKILIALLDTTTPFQYLNSRTKLRNFKKNQLSYPMSTLMLFMNYVQLIGILISIKMKFRKYLKNMSASSENNIITINRKNSIQIDWKIQLTFLKSLGKLKSHFN